MNKKRKLNNRGSSFVETMISMAIIAVVVVSILNGFTHQQVRAKSMTNRAYAMQLAELRMEELLKFPTPQLTDEVITDYIVVKSDSFVVYNDVDTYNPNVPNQFRRISTITIDSMSETATINVRVDYPLINHKYPFKVELTSRRGIK